MKHLIIVNGSAGKQTQKEALLATVKKEFADLDYEVYETTGPKSVIPFLKDYFTKNTKGILSIYYVALLYRNDASYFCSYLY